MATTPTGRASAEASSKASPTLPATGWCNSVPAVPGRPSPTRCSPWAHGHLTLVDLDTEKAKQLAELLAKDFGPERVSVGAAGDLTEILAGAEGVINTTPVGMDAPPGLARYPIPTCGPTCGSPTSCIVRPTPRCSARLGPSAHERWTAAA